MDFLLHEVVVRTQLQRSQRHLALPHRPLDRLAVGIGQADAVAGQACHVPLFQKHHAPRGTQDGRNVGSDEVCLLPQTDQQRAAHACHHQFARPVLCHHADGVGTRQFAHGLPHGFEQITASQIMPVDQVGNHLGIGLRLEGIAGRSELVTSGFMVFDDAVMHQCNQAAGNVRVGIGLGHASVGSPTGMANAQASAQSFGPGGSFHFGHTADPAYPADAVPGKDGQPRGIVAAVFQPLEAVDQQRHDVLAGNRPDNSTHWQSSYTLQCHPCGWHVEDSGAHCSKPATPHRLSPFAAASSHSGSAVSPGPASAHWPGPFW